MFYTVYKITNMVNGKIYIGVHKTNDLNDDYMGSGKLVKAAIEKYGVENFTREYLHVFDNAEDMFNMESELVNEEFVARDDTYNLALGGRCTFYLLNTSEVLRARLGSENFPNWYKAGKKAFLEKFYGDDDFRNLMCEKLKLSSKLGVEKLKSIYEECGWTFSNKTHSDETKRKIGQANSIAQIGDKNSQFGTMWIMNAKSGESKKIKKDDLIPDGWVKGRKIKKV